MAKRRTTKAAVIPDVEPFRQELDATAYNEAVRVQAAVRDWIGYPVTLVQALTIARETFRELHIGCVSDEFTAYVTDPARRKRALERAAEDADKARLDEQKRIAADAGRR